MVKVLGHVCGEHHVDDGLSQQTVVVTETSSVGTVHIHVHEFVYLMITTILHNAHV